MAAIRKLAIVTGVLAVLGASQGSASAHGDAVYHGADFAHVSADHLTGQVCDNEKDGHWVYAVFYLENGSQVGAYGNGADAPCAALRLDSPAIEFEIWEEGKPRSFREWT